MNKKLILVYACCTILTLGIKAQSKKSEKSFTHADTLRGSITPERAWWNVLRYDITVQPDFDTKTIIGSNKISYQVTSESYPAVMQIDLQVPLIIDSILSNQSTKLELEHERNVCLVQVPKQKKSAIDAITVYYHGKPREAVRPPWDGGWIWTTDSLNRPWMSAACQALGASVWYPCKDHQSDEPDNGASLSIIVPDTLVGVGNGRLLSKNHNTNGTTTYVWEVKDPINNYDIIPYIGKYSNFSEAYDGVKGKLDLNYWVLDYNIDKAKEHSSPDVHRMLKAFEYWFGPYPFYTDGYKLVDAPHLGMEHQSATAYGNKYLNGYLGKDLSNTGWGLKWDYIIVHESGHEWFGNNITTNDIADMWVHEGITDYSETLFTDYHYGTEAGNEYNFGQREGIQNKQPIISLYGVNFEPPGDMYPKGANLMHSIRHSIHDDEKFRQILHGLNETFYHKTVNSIEVESYISKKSGFDYSHVFDQYLRDTRIPILEFSFSKKNKNVRFRWTNCNVHFNLPLALENNQTYLKIEPTTQWQTISLQENEASLFDAKAMERKYYIKVKPTK